MTDIRVTRISGWVVPCPDIFQELFNFPLQCYYHIFCNNNLYLKYKIISHSTRGNFGCIMKGYIAMSTTQQRCLCGGKARQGKRGRESEARKGRNEVCSVLYQHIMLLPETQEKIQKYGKLIYWCDSTVKNRNSILAWFLSWAVEKIAGLKVSQSSSLSLDTATMLGTGISG